MNSEHTNRAALFFLLATMDEALVLEALRELSFSLSRKKTSSKSFFMQAKKDQGAEELKVAQSSSESTSSANSELELVAGILIFARQFVLRSQKQKLSDAFQSQYWKWPASFSHLAWKSFQRRSLPDLIIALLLVDVCGFNPDLVCKAWHISLGTLQVRRREALERISVGTDIKNPKGQLELVR